MWKIGLIPIEGKVVLAPMAGITNVAYRKFMKSFGVALSYTEMVSDCGLIYKNQETYRYLQTDEEDRPIAVQLFGGTKETLLKGLKCLEESGQAYDILDINLGCPVVKVIKTGAGSAWLKRPQELYEMMKAIVEASKKPVTAKIRLGWDETSINVREVVQLLEQAGVSMIAIHARTRAQLYSGNARFELLRGLRSEMHIPLVVSGDIFSLEDAIRVQEETQADAVMVARGAMGNPHLIRQIDHYFRTGEKLANISLQKNLTYLERHFQMLCELKGEVIAVREMRGIAPHYLKGYPNTKQDRMYLASSLVTADDFYRAIERIRKNATIYEEKHV